MDSRRDRLGKYKGITVVAERKDSEGMVEYDRVGKEGENSFQCLDVYIIWACSEYYVGTPRFRWVDNIESDVLYLGFEETWTEGDADKIGSRKLAVQALGSQARCSLIFI